MVGDSQPARLSWRWPFVSPANHLGCRLNRYWKRCGLDACPCDDCQSGLGAGQTGWAVNSMASPSRGRLAVACTPPTFMVT